MLKDAPGAVFLRAGQNLAMPLFTSEENASLYKRRTAMDCRIIRIEAAAHLEAYISNPPGRTPSTDDDFAIMVDPIDANTGEYIVFPKQDFLDALRQYPTIELDLAFPVHLLLSDAFVPFTMPSADENIWPVFDTKEHAGAFAIGVGRPNLVIAAFISAAKLYQMMMGVRPEEVTTVWLHEHVVDERSIQFRDRLPVGEFLAALRSQADKENKADQT